MPRQVELTLHLGAHKTASTHLQQSIFAYQEQVIEAGVRPYGPEYLRSRGRNIPALFGLSQWTNVKCSDRTPAEQIEFLSKGDRRIFLTEENFLGALHLGNGHLSLPVYQDAAERVEALAQAVPDVLLRVFVAIRSPDSFLESAYSQTVFSGNFLDPDQFVSSHPFFEIDWPTMIAGLVGVPGVHSVHVWRYEDYHAVFKTLIRRMLRWKLGGVIEPIDTVLHPSLSQNAMAEVMRAKQAGTKVNAQSVRSDHPVTPQNPKFTLYGPEQRAEASQLYEQQVDEIRSMEKVQFYGA